jgi:hypothetical protein
MFEEFKGNGSREGRGRRGVSALLSVAQLYEPAQLPDGTTVPYPVRRRFVFKPAQV